MIMMISGNRTLKTIEEWVFVQILVLIQLHHGGIYAVRDVFSSVISPHILSHNKGSSVAMQVTDGKKKTKKKKTKDFRGEASLCIRLSAVSTVVCGLDSQSKPGLSSSQDNVSVSGQSERLLNDLWKAPYTGDLSNSLGKGWICCVIDGITRHDAFSLFHFIINNKIRRIIDFLNCIKNLGNNKVNANIWKHLSDFCKSLELLWIHPCKKITSLMCGNLTIYNDPLFQSVFDVPVDALFFVRNIWTDVKTSSLWNSWLSVPTHDV